MRTNSTLAAVLLAVAPAALLAQVSFTDQTTLLNGNTASGGVVGVVDMDGDGLDDIAIMDDSNNFIVEYQQANGTFIREDYGSVSSANQWGMALGDTDNDGHKDLFCGGNNDGTHHMKISSIGNATIGNLNNGTLFMQCTNIADVDNDGWADAFGCNDVGPSRIWLNDGAGELIYDDYIDFTTAPVSDMSGNYGSCWTDFDNDGDLDLYIAKCRQGVNDPTDPRRINVLYENDGFNNFTNTAGAHGIDIGYQSWSADFGDIDNDGDFDLAVTNHDHTMQLFENDGTGNFTEITAGSGLEDVGFFLQSIFRDFDNDGYVDLLIAGGLDGIYMNNGDKTFTNTAVPSAPKDLHSFGLGDLNNDGAMDIFASYGDGYVTPDPTTPDRLWLNNGNANHWFTVDLEGTASNRDAIGARIEIYGPWGVQVREVRSGESYGIVNSFKAHFGLGTSTVVDSVVVNWPGGQVQTEVPTGVDMTVLITEPACTSPITATITTAGPAVICGTQTLDLTASGGSVFQWSTGETSSTITVTAGGNYSVQVTDGAACSGFETIEVLQDPDETPIVSLDNEAVLCDGDQVTLTSTTATSYLWSTNATTQSIVVTQTGNYTVTIPGVCGSFMSSLQAITVMPIPADPVAADVTNAPGPATLTATSTADDIYWYDVATGGNPVGTGTPWITPSLTATTSFWAEAVNVNGGGVSFGGLQDNSGGGGYFGNNNQHLIFEAYDAFTIKSVKVYADGAGSRTIELIEEPSGNTVEQGTFNVPDGESRIQLDFDVPGVGEYGLRVSSNSPDLWRNNQGSISYPFALGSVGSILRSTAGQSLDFYYFFYDWEVEPPSTVCASGRVEVVANIITSVDELNGLAGLSVWPNPAQGNINISYVGGALQVKLMDLTGREVLSASGDQTTMAQGPMTLDLQGLATGEYMLQAISDEGMAVHRVVVQ